MTKRQLIENAIRDHLSGTSRKISKEGMQMTLQHQFSKAIAKGIFNRVWENLIDEKYLLKADRGLYIWESVPDSQFIINGRTL